MAREYGFKGTPQDLYVPEINLEYGCKYLKVCIKRAHGDIRQGLLRWNGGGNLLYDDEVLEKYEILKAMEV